MHTQIHISNPCHKNWGKMEEVEQGRYCGSCKEVVIDFSGMSASELIHYFEKHKGKTGCGRFRTDQLGLPAQRKPKSFLHFRHLFSLLLFPLLAFLVSPLHAAEQSATYPKAHEQELGPGPTISHYHGRLLRRMKKSKRGHAMGKF